MSDDDMRARRSASTVRHAALLLIALRGGATSHVVAPAGLPLWIRTARRASRSNGPNRRRYRDQRGRLRDRSDPASAGATFHGGGACRRRCGRAREGGGRGDRPSSWAGGGGHRGGGERGRPPGARG